MENFGLPLLSNFNGVAIQGYDSKYNKKDEILGIPIDIALTTNTFRRNVLIQLPAREFRRQGPPIKTEFVWNIYRSKTKEETSAGIFGTKSITNISLGLG